MMICPPPTADEGPIEMIIWRIGQLEKQVETLVAALNKQAGAWTAVKMLGGFLVGATVVFAFVLDNFVLR